MEHLGKTIYTDQGNLNYFHNIDTECSHYPTPIPSYQSTQSTSSRMLVITSSCKVCNAPIYGYERIYPNEDPVVKYSCRCRLK